jgi:hypothetical protein
MFIFSGLPSQTDMANNVEGVSDLYDEPPNLSVATTEIERDGDMGEF